MTGQSGSVFDPRVMIGLIMAGIIGFLGFWIITAFAPEIGSGRDGGGHALSRSAVGYAGVVAVMRAAGMQPQVARNPERGLVNAGNSETGGLMVLTPPPNASYAAIAERLDFIDGAVLIVLPKYRAVPDPAGDDRIIAADQANGWAIQWLGEMGVKAPSMSLETPRRRTVNVDPWGDGNTQLHLPGQLLTMTGGGLEPVLSVDGRTLIGALPGRGSTYVLADADLLNNLAMADDDRAASAVRLLIALAGPDEPIGFDVTLNGLGQGRRSLLRMAFTPPFLALTICLLAAGLLALWQGFVRFGPPWREVRNLAFGKQALVGANAQLVVQARRTRNFGPRYVAMVREAAARRLHAPTRLSADALDRWLDRFADRHGRRFSMLAHDLESARSSDRAVACANALGQWRRDVLRDRE